MGFLDLFRRHLKIEVPSTEYYELGTEFNTRWVSRDYGGNTATRIKMMPVGAPIHLSWSDTPFRDGEHIKVLDWHRKQIGWAPIYPCEDGKYSFVDDRLIKAIQNDWPIEAHVKRKGKVDDPAKNIWWCVVTVRFKVPYVPTGEDVYMALNHNRYHLDPNCGKAEKKKVPLFLAKEFGKVPCPKCACCDKEDT